MSFQTFSTKLAVFGSVWTRDRYFHACRSDLLAIAPIDKLSVALVIVFGALFLEKDWTWARAPAVS